MEEFENVVEQPEIVQPSFEENKTDSKGAFPLENLKAQMIF